MTQVSTVSVRHSNCSLMALPNEILQKIFCLIGTDHKKSNSGQNVSTPADKFRLRFVCGRFCALIEDSRSWKENKTLNLQYGDGFTINGIYFNYLTAPSALRDLLNVAPVVSVIASPNVDRSTCKPIPRQISKFVAKLKNYRKRFNSVENFKFELCHYLFEGKIIFSTFLGLLGNISCLEIQFRDVLPNLRSISLDLVAPLVRLKKVTFGSSEYDKVAQVLEGKAVQELKLQLPNSQFSVVFEHYVLTTSQLAQMVNAIPDGVLKKLEIGFEDYQEEDVAHFINFQQWITLCRPESLQNISQLQIPVSVFPTNLPESLYWLPSLTYLEINCLERIDRSEYSMREFFQLVTNLINFFAHRELPLSVYFKIYCDLLQFVDGMEQDRMKFPISWTGIKAVNDEFASFGKGNTKVGLKIRTPPSDYDIDEDDD